MDAMAATNRNFIVGQRTIYEATRVAHNEVSPQPDANTAASCASYAPLSNYRGCTWQVDSDGPSTSIIDPTSTDTGDGQAADPSEDE